MSGERYIYPTAKLAAEHAGDFILQLLKDSVSASGRASIAISGGTSPRLMFEHMAQTRFDWSAVHLFWVDDRGVPPTDPQSNYRFANESLIGPAKIPAENVHRVQTELPPQEAAQRYDTELRSFFGLGGTEEMPRFDVVHRGVGPDGHTASLFPGTPLIDDRENLVAAPFVEKFQQYRITLLPGPLLAAANTVMLATGTDKADALQHVLDGPEDFHTYPAQLFARKVGNTAWFFDVDAVKLIP